MCRPASRSPLRRSRCWRPTRCATSASRSRWSSPRRARRRSMPPSAWSIDWTAAAGGHHGCRRARAGRAADLRRGAGQCLHGLALGRRTPPSMRRSQPPRMSCRCASTTTASSPIRWSRAARSAATMRRSGRYTLIVSSQNIHGNRDATARALGVPPADVRFIAPDVGGGFGAKNFTYAEHALILWAAQARRPPGEMDRHAQRGLRLRSPGARPSGRGVAGARCGRQVPGAAGQQRGEYRRLHGGRRRRGADQPVCASARQHLRNSRHRAARRDGAEQHHADRRDARPRLCRGGERHRTADRRGGAAVRLRSRGTAPPQHGARHGDADDQCAWFLGGQRRFRADLRSCAGGGRCRRICRTARRKRGTRTAARTWLRLPHQGHRRLAARERRYPFRVRTARCR